MVTKHGYGSHRGTKHAAAIANDLMDAPVLTPVVRVFRRIHPLADGATEAGKSSPPELLFKC